MGIPLSLGPLHLPSCLTHLCSLRAYLDVDLTLTREQTERLSQQIASHVVSAAQPIYSTAALHVGECGSSQLPVLAS